MSYMDDKNILKEGIIDKIIRKLITQPILKRSSKFSNAVDDLNDAISDFEKAATAEIRRNNPKAKPVKIKRYKV